MNDGMHMTGMSSDGAMIGPHWLADVVGALAALVLLGAVLRLVARQGLPTRAQLEADVVQALAAASVTCLLFPGLGVISPGTLDFMIALWSAVALWFLVGVIRSAVGAGAAVLDARGPASGAGFAVTLLYLFAATRRMSAGMNAATPPAATLDLVLLVGAISYVVLALDRMSGSAPGAAGRTTSAWGTTTAWSSVVLGLVAAYLLVMVLA